MSKASLFDIVEEIRSLDNILDELDGDITGAEDVISDFFRKSEGDLKNKVEGYCKIIKEKEAIASARKEEAKRIQSLAKIDENRIKLLKSRLLDAFNELEIKKLETDTFKVSVAKNGGKSPLVILNEEKALAEYGENIMTLTTDSKERLRADAESGEITFAVIGERGKSIRIK